MAVRSIAGEREATLRRIGSDCKSQTGVVGVVMFAGMWGTVQAIAFPRFVVVVVVGIEA